MTGRGLEGHGTHDLRLFGENMTRHMKRITAQVHGGSAAHRIGESDIRGVFNGNIEMRTNLSHRTQLAALNEINHTLRHGVIAPMKGLHEEKPCSRSGLRHALGLKGIGCERFFAQNRLAGFKSPKRPFTML